jgi:CheY-like chemotaxis protein
MGLDAPPTALVVDDSDLDRELTIRCLKKAWPGAGQPILDSAGDGIEALQLVRSVAYSLLILAGRRT